MNRDPKPEVLRLEELALMVKGGDVKLPRFQRPFVWRRQDMLKLLDSIYRGYPIGSLLLWHSSQRLSSERDIAGLEVDQQSTIYPTNYLLDGQQRLTTLCGALFWDGVDSTSAWNIAFDLESEEFVHPRGDLPVNQFPLNRLIDTSDFIRQCMKFEHHPRKALYVARAERLLRAIKDYKVAVVKIGDMTLEEVAPIFERINSTGRKLTMVDLMMAATWSNGFDLATEIQSISRECAEIGFGSLTEAIILRSLATSAGLGPNKDDIQRLRGLKPEELRAASSACRSGMLKAAEFLRQNTPVKDASYLPYALQITHLAEFFRLVSNPSPSQADELRRWFWRTSVGLYFAGASTGQNSKDLARTRDFARGLAPDLGARGPIDVSRLLFDRFTLRNASSTTFALLLFDAKPIWIGSDGSLDLIASLELSSKHFQAIQFGASAVNVQMTLNPFGNTSAWMLPPEKLVSHLLSEECVKQIELGSFDAFAEARGRIVAKRVADLTNETVIANSPEAFDRSLREYDEQDRDE